MATLSGPGSVWAAADASFGDTLSWQGIVSLTDGSGAPIGGLNAVSPSSGFDAAQPCVAAVPEPATGLLMLSGAAFCLRLNAARGTTRCGPALRPAPV